MTVSIGVCGTELAIRGLALPAMLGAADAALYAAKHAGRNCSRLSATLLPGPD